MLLLHGCRCIRPLLPLISSLSFSSLGRNEGRGGERGRREGREQIMEREARERDSSVCDGRQ